MKIIFYSDVKYEYQASALISSINLNVLEDVQIIYYTIGFESSLNQKNLTKRVYPLDTSNKKFEFYKPSIMLDAIDTFGEGDYLFLDTDIIVSEKFKIEKVKNSYDFPMFPIGVWEWPFLFSGDIIFDESKLMKYMGVEKRSMMYIYSCLCSFNERCRDVILEWKSVCDNQFLTNSKEVYFPFKDETPINVILWRRNVDKNFGKIFLNTHEYDKIILSEESKLNKDTRLDFLNNLEEFYLDDIMFYHGVKEKETLDRLIDYFKNKKES